MFNFLAGLVRNTLGYWIFIGGGFGKFVAKLFKKWCTFLLGAGGKLKLYWELGKVLILDF